jgi:hypothetical protein
MCWKKLYSGTLIKMNSNVLKAIPGFTFYNEIRCL